MILCNFNCKFRSYTRKSFKKKRTKKEKTEYGNLTGMLAEEIRRTNSRKKGKKKQIDLSKIIPRLRKSKQ